MSSMKRREFITLFGGAVAAWPLAARAQEAERPRRVGILIGSFEKDDSVPQAELNAFKEALAAAGWHEGTNVHFEYRWGGGAPTRIRSAAKDLANLRLDVIVTRAAPATAEMLKQTTTIPVVFVQVANPVRVGFVKSFARPSANVTGFANEEPSIPSKWLALLKELLPRLNQATLIHHPETTLWDDLIPVFEGAAVSLGIKANVVPVRDAIQIENAIAAARSVPTAALVAAPDSFIAGHHDLVIRLAAQNRLPLMAGFKYWTQHGGLISYGSDPTDLFRRTASYVDRILRGTRPTDLPVQGPTRFEMVINLKTSKALDLEIPPMLLARADEVIE